MADTVKRGSRAAGGSDGGGERDDVRHPVGDDASRVARDVEAYLVAAREWFGEDLPVERAGAGQGTGAARRGQRSEPPADRVGEEVAGPWGAAPRPAAAARGTEASGRAPGVAPAAAASRDKPPQPHQTSLLGEAAAQAAPSPGLRRSRAADAPVTGAGDGPPIDRAPCKRERRAEILEAIDAEVRVCARCGLSASRTRTVFGVGDPCARLCFVGEGPGAEEDRQGEPFVGRAGQLLNRIIAAMRLNRSDVYIANTVKCRPPENRTPSAEEMQACAPYLARQLEAITPQIIVALGRPAVQALLATSASMGEVRGRFHRHRGIPVMPTYHPAYLLRNPAAKKTTWEDIRQVMRFLEENPDPLKGTGGPSN